MIQYTCVANLRPLACYSDDQVVHWGRAFKPCLSNVRKDTYILHNLRCFVNFLLVLWQRSNARVFSLVSITESFFLDNFTCNFHLYYTYRHGERGWMNVDGKCQCMVKGVVVWFGNLVYQNMTMVIICYSPRWKFGVCFWPDTLLKWVWEGQKHVYTHVQYLYYMLL